MKTKKQKKLNIRKRNYLNVNLLWRQKNELVFAVVAVDAEMILNGEGKKIVAVVCQRNLLLFFVLSCV